MTSRRIYELLPAVYRIRDEEHGKPLEALLQIIGEQVDLVEADIARLYDNWFIETCEEWVVPYIAELVGYRLVQEAGKLIPRREVANTIRYRRRKGTLAVLELLANDIAGWPARAVEYYNVLGWNQSVNHLYPDRARTVDVRQAGALALAGGPFDPLARGVDVRRINSRLTAGRHNSPERRPVRVAAQVLWSHSDAGLRRRSGRAAGVHLQRTRQ